LNQVKVAQQVVKIFVCLAGGPSFVENRNSLLFVVSREHVQRSDRSYAARSDNEGMTFCENRNARNVEGSDPFCKQIENSSSVFDFHNNRYLFNCVLTANLRSCRSFRNGPSSNFKSAKKHVRRPAGKTTVTVVLELKQ
jgi:hypothetical protein